MASTVWRGYVSFGLISIPVRLFRAARAERVGLRRLYRAAPEREEPESVEEVPVRSGRRLAEAEAPPPSAGRTEPVEMPAPAAAVAARAPVLTPLQQVSIRKGTEEIAREDAVVKGYEFEKGRYVALEAEELKTLVPKTSTQMEIQEFVALDEIDPVYFETSYYFMPEEAGEKAYALLYRAMQTTGLVAIAQFAMHTRDHVVVLRPGKSGLLAHTMFYASEVRADEEFRADTSVVVPKELGLAETLIRSLAAPFEPGKYRDTYRERLESMIEKKVKGQPVAPVSVPSRPAAVVDIAEALRKSLANLKKPPRSEPAPVKEPAAPEKRAKSSRVGRK